MIVCLTCCLAGSSFDAIGELGSPVPSQMKIQDEARLKCTREPAVQSVSHYGATKDPVPNPWVLERVRCGEGGEQVQTETVLASLGVVLVGADPSPGRLS